MNTVYLITIVFANGHTETSKMVADSGQGVMAMLDAELGFDHDMAVTRHTLRALGAPPEYLDEFNMLAPEAVIKHISITDTGEVVE